MRAFPHPKILFKLVCFLNRLMAKSTSLSIKSGYFKPLCSQSLGYILMEVNPGIVLISLIITSPFSFKKPSTRPIPEQQRTLNVFLASSWNFLAVTAGIFAGILRTAPSASRYLAS